MADHKKIVRLVQLKIQNTTTDFKNHIDDVIEVAWAYLASMAEWWFLEQGDPYPIVLVNDETDYVVEKDNVGKLLYIANEKGQRLWDYKSRRNFLKYRDSGPGRNYNNNTTEQPGSVSVFTTAGKKSGKITIRLYRSPDASQIANTGTVFLHWQEAGTIANIDKLPVGWVKVLMHLIGTMIEPPEEMNNNKFKAMTYKEEDLFRVSLDDMIRKEVPASDDVDEFDCDDKVQSELDAINLM